MNIYLDTNVIIAFFNSNDPMVKQAQKVFQQQNLTFYAGFITILEFEAVIGRMWTNHQIQFDQSIEDKVLNLTEPIQIKIITETCFNILPIKIVLYSALENLVFNNVKYSVENTFTLAYRICPLIHLRTLDLIQIATALKIKSLGGFNIDYFLTNDQNILNYGQEIYSKLDLLPISCTELLSILKISL